MTQLPHTIPTLVLVLILYSVETNAQSVEAASCFGAGSIVAAVILTFLCTIGLIAALYYIWRRRASNKETHLILETDAEKGKGEYAFDNPGFKETSIISEHTEEKSPKSKWNQWAPLAVFSTKHDKRKTLDDSYLQNQPVKVVALQSRDFTGLGFNIYGNMKEGIYIKDILHRGPAYESGKLSSGDRINSVTISFEHIVFEDALTILSYASPYEVIIEAKSGKISSATHAQNGEQPTHPMYRSASCTDLHYVGTKSKKHHAIEDQSGSSSNYSSLQKSKQTQNMHNTLERKESPSKPKSYIKKNKVMTPEQLKSQLEQRISADHQLRVKEKQLKSEGTVESPVTPDNNNKYQKFGVKVLPMDLQQISPKITEQNENNMNIETTIQSIDEVDNNNKPQAKKREKKTEAANFTRNDDHNSSLIKRDENGIPQEIPNFLFNAAVAARNNRKSVDDKILSTDDEIKTPKRLKGKAPRPPAETHTSETYNSDSDNENHSSVNTIELNSNDITVHHADDDERHENRRTASTGDLARIKKLSRSNGTLERAQSLDISSEPNNKDELLQSSEDLFFSSAILNKEPRLSLILDGLNTFQKNRLKKSTEWGNLEDAILKLDDTDDSLDSSLHDSSKSEFEALVNKVNEIKRESIIEIDEDILAQYKVLETDTNPPKPVVRNQIWPIMDKDVKEEVEVFEKKPTQIKSQESIIKTTEKQGSTFLKMQMPLSDEKSNIKSELNFKQPANESSEKKSPFQNTPEAISAIHITETKYTKQIEQEAEPTFPQISSAQPEGTFQIIHLMKPEGPKDVYEQKPVIGQENHYEINIPEKQENESSEKIAPKTFERIGNITPMSKLEQQSYEKRQQIPVNTSEESTITVPTESHEESVKYEVDVAPKITTRQRIPEVAFKSWELTDISPPPSLDIDVIEESNSSSPKLKTRTEYLLSQVPGLSLNTTDEIKIQDDGNSQEEFIFNERHFRDTTNASDDIKVSLNTVTKSSENLKSDDAKRNNISNIAVTENGSASNLHSLEFSINEPNELYTTALENSVVEPKITISTPDLIKNVTLTEALTAVNKEKDDSLPEQNSSLTYVTEIQVTPNSSGNISEIEVIPNGNRNLEDEFENYVKNFEEKLESFEHNIHSFESDLSEFIKEESNASSIVINNDNVTKEVHKIQEMAEEQLKKLPEMRFTTSSYETVGGRKTPEKRNSFEALRSNFENRNSKKDSPKSRIPIATTAKTPPTSPERRDSRNLENEQDKAILELMNTGIHSSTPYANSKIKPPSKNVTVTSIRSLSRIPSSSGLPTFSGRPPIPPRKPDNDDHVVHVSTNGNVDSNFKQWVFNPANVTNVTVDSSNKDKHN